MNMYDQYLKSTVPTSRSVLSTFSIVLASVAAGAAILSVAALGISSYRKVDKNLTNYILPHSEVTVNSGSQTSSHSVVESINAVYQSNKVMLSELECQSPNRWRRRTKWIVARELKLVTKTNILPCYGFYTIGKPVYAVWEHPAKGSLEKAIGSAKFEIDQDIKTLLCINLVDGVNYLHQHGIVLGSLSSRTCYLDGGWTLKIGHWLDDAIYSTESPEALSVNRNVDVNTLTYNELIKLYFKDPRTFSGVTDKIADLFSIGMLLHEVFSIESNSARTDEHDQDFIGIVQRKLYTSEVQFRQKTKEIPLGVKVLIDLCTGEFERRPSPQFLTKELTKIRNRKSGIVDQLMEQMEDHMTKLEEKVQERAAALEKQADQLKIVTGKMQDILYEVLPMEVAKQLIAGQRPEPEQFECVTILFSDLVEFTNVSSMLQPSEVMELLNDLWLLFDEVTSKHDVYKVDTIGDCYMVGSGVPRRNETKHVKEIADMSMALLTACRSSKIRVLGGRMIRVRVGINSGPVIAGVVGRTMPQYCVFGDAVNTASRMESTSLPMKIQISSSTNELLQAHYKGEYRTHKRGLVELKGKGYLETFWLIPSDADFEDSVTERWTPSRSKNTLSPDKEIDHYPVTIESVG